MEELKKLIDLKSIITLVITIALIAGFFLDKVTPENFFAIALMVFTFYFSKKNSEGANK